MLAKDYIRNVLSREMSGKFYYVVRFEEYRSSPVEFKDFLIMGDGFFHILDKQNIVRSIPLSEIQSVVYDIKTGGNNG